MKAEMHMIILHTTRKFVTATPTSATHRRTDNKILNVLICPSRDSVELALVNYFLLNVLLYNLINMDLPLRTTETIHGVSLEQSLPRVREVRTGVE